MEQQSTSETSGGMGEPGPPQPRSAVSEPKRSKVEGQDSGYQSAPPKVRKKTRSALEPNLSTLAQRSSCDSLPRPPPPQNGHTYDTGPPPAGTMERYLDDQFQHWTGQTGLPPGTPPRTMTNPYKDSINDWPTRVMSAYRPEPPMHRFFPESSGEISDEENSPLKRFTTRPKKDHLQRRVVEKNGDHNVKYKNVSRKKRRYIYDIYTTMVDSRWLTTLLVFSLSFYVTWLFFAVVYYVICYYRGDFEPDHLPSKQGESGWTPCVWMMEDFASAFLFSLETQHTIGYGSRQTTNKCPEAIIVMSTQSVIGCLIQAFMVGLVFAKLSRPKARVNTIVFSKQAVICERDKKMCLLFRVGDMRHDSFIVGCQISAKLIRRRVTQEGEMYHDVSPINIIPDAMNESCLFLIWPMTMVHPIDEESPFYNLSATELAADKFELHVVFEGTIEATSATFQARTSYLPNEILWGHRFEPMMLYRRDHNKYQVNFSAFHSTYEVDTPVCSASDLDEYNRVRASKKSNARSFTGMHPPRSVIVAPSQRSFGVLPSTLNPLAGSSPPQPREPGDLKRRPNFNLTEEEDTVESSSTNSDEPNGGFQQVLTQE